MDRTLKPSLVWPTSQAQDKTAPERKPRRAPVFINDALTQLGDGTLLLALWQQQHADREDQ